MFGKILSSLFFSFSLAEAKIVVISDIDDTIKISHILDKSDGVSKAFKTGNVFFGMNMLYQEIKNQNPEIEFYYISNAVRSIMGLSHQHFLESNQFPAGFLALRDNPITNDHKVQSIRLILKDPKIKFVIFIGDNGERDAKIYSQIVQEFPNLPQITYIRQAYSVSQESNDDIGTPIEAGQLGFVTPVEISLEFARLGILTPQQVDRIESAFTPRTISRSRHEDRSSDDGVISFPRWIDCRDFKIPDSLIQRKTVLGQRLVNRIKARCSRPAFDD